MGTSKTNNRSTRRSRKLIRDAFLELIRTIPIERITVTDIAEKADINRGTFYTHYKDVLALVEEIQNEMTHKMLEIADSRSYLEFCCDPFPSLAAASKYISENEYLYRAMINYGDTDRVAVEMADIYISHIMMDESIPKPVRTDPCFIVTARYHAAGLINTYASWFRGKLPISLDEIAVELSRSIKAGSRAIIEKKE